MSYTLGLGLVALITASLLLIIYSDHATKTGLRQGVFFLSLKASIMGYMGLIFAIIIGLYKTSILYLAIIFAASFFLLAPVLLSWLGMYTQLFSVVGFWLGLFISLIVES